MMNYYAALSCSKLGRTIEAQKYCKAGLSYRDEIENCFEDRYYLRELRQIEREVGD